MGGPGFEARVTRVVEEVLSDGRSPYAARVVLAMLIADDAAKSELDKPRAVYVAAYRLVASLAEKGRPDAAANTV